MVLKLYKLDASPPVRSVYMVIHQLHIADVEYIEVNVLERENLHDSYIKINPQHTVPTLVDDDFIVWDSHVIATYLVNKYAENDSLYPVDPKRRAIIDQRLHFDNGILFTTLREIVGSVLLGNENDVSAELKDKMCFGYDLLDKFLATSTWLAGDDLTLADICCMSTISSANVLVAIEPDLYPNLWMWLKRCSELDCYKTANAPGLAQFTKLMHEHLHKK